MIRRPLMYPVVGLLALGIAASIVTADDHQHDTPVLKLDPTVTGASPAASPSAAASAATSAPALDAETRALGSYGVGYKVGRDLGGSFNDTLDAQKVSEGLMDGLAGKKPPQAEKLGVAMPKFIQAVQAIVEGRQAGKDKEAQVQGEVNKKKGEEYLTKNKARAGVTVTKSGLQYEVVTEGKGAKPKPTDQVQVHYKGTLVDGTEFDSSHKRGEPATFGVTQVIPGWVEGLQLMPVGSKWKFHIPSELAYGARAMGNIIGPHSTLVFEVELLAIK